jgi:spore maturation protein CgeB
MGSGCFALSHHYEDIEKDFKVGYHLDSFKTIDEMISKCEFYLKNSILRQTIALKGYNYVQDCFSVDVMVEEILRIYEKYSTIRQLVRSL